jgi:aryl-alcohol dehydrogenase-like predicted oxidoreductase
LAWVLSQGDHIFPIPGTKRIKYLEENAGALNVRLTPAELSLIDVLAPTGVAAGERYHPEMMGSLNR